MSSCVPKSMLRRRAASALPGFTLLEMLLAIALLLILAGGVFLFLIDLLGARERLSLESSRSRDTSRLMEIIEHAAFTATVLDGDGPGVLGTSDAITLAAHGLALDRQGLAPGRVVRLALDDSARAINATVTVERADGGVGERVELVSGVERLRFRYLVDGAWRDSFDSARAGRLPAAIEVAVWFDRTRGDAAEIASEGATAGDDALGVPGFDDQAAATIAEEQEFFAENELEGLPVPDRYRVIAVPDAEAVEAAPGAGGSAGFSAGFDGGFVDRGIGGAGS